MKTAIVILNWNTKDFLERFLPILLASIKGCKDTEVIVADNASTDGSVIFMKDNFPDIRTIAFEKNFGFTGGYNRAFEQIAGEGCVNAPEYFLLLNTDVEVPQGWLEPLVGWMDSHPECAACGPKLHSWKDREMFEYAGAAGGYIDSFGYPFCRGRIMGKVEHDLGQYDRMHPEVFWSSGACLLIRSSVFAELGGFDDRFFAHMEEIDLCWRMHLAGYSVCNISSSTVYHVGGGTLPSSSPFKLFLNYRNNLLMLNKNMARTFAIKHYKDTGDAERSAEAGLSEADRMVRLRMFLDMLSAGVYLLTFKFKAFGAVIRAHKEYRKLRRPVLKSDIAGFLTERKDIEIRHIFGKWIVLQQLIYGRKIFAGIHETDFFKF